MLSDIPETEMTRVIDHRLALALAAAVATVVTPTHTQGKGKEGAKRKKEKEEVTMILGRQAGMAMGERG